MNVNRPTLDFLLGLYALRTTAEASAWIVNGLAKLFHAENAILCRHDGTRRILTAVVAKEPFSRANLMPSINESGIMAQHPFWNGVFLPNEPVRSLSGIASRKVWHANPLYNEVFRPDGIEDQLNTEVLGDALAFTTVNVLRSRRGFTASEVALLHLLRDHIGQALMNAQRLENAGVFLNSSASTIMIPLDYHGRLQSLDHVGGDDPFADLVMETGHLSSTVQDWVKSRVRLLNSGAFENRLAPLCHREGNRVWEYSLHRDLQNGSYRLLVVPGPISPGTRVALSARENEVMAWVEKGKSNEQISEILGLSMNTVKTLLKRAFIKLGVENRTAAVSAMRHRT
jgi:DNA-binding CsgD family transcriptional regulator